MKKKLAMMAAALAMMLGLSGCNYGVVDMVYKYDYAIISLPNGEIVEGKVDTWYDYENSDQIQVEIDGKIYLVHSEDICLIKN